MIITGIGLRRFTCDGSLPFMAALIFSGVHCGWSRRTQAASAVGSSTRTQPWLKSRRAREKSVCDGVECRYTLFWFGNMNFTKPRALLGPGFWRTERSYERRRASVAASTCDDL